jgi:hypothetical protein
VVSSGGDLGDHGLGDAVEQRLLGRQVIVERHGLDIEVGGETTHRQRLNSLRVRQCDSRRQHALTAERFSGRLRCR